MPSAAAATSPMKPDDPDLTDDDSDAEAEVKNVKAYCDAWEEEGEIGENRARELKAEIELLELMLSKGTAGLLDLYVMREEIEDLKASELEDKAGELQEGHWEVKRSILELKKKKSRELVRWVERSEIQKLGSKSKAVEIVNENENEEERGGDDEEFGGNDGKVLKLNWGLILTAIGAGALAAAAAGVLLIGRVKIQNPKKCTDRDQPRSSSINTDVNI